MYVTHPEPYEGAIQFLAKQVLEIIAQIDGGQYPQYDGNCRRNIAENLQSIAKDRESQRELDPDYPFEVISIEGINEGYLPDDLTLGEFRRIRKYVLVPTE
jgi:hypothetical protein